MCRALHKYVYVAIVDGILLWIMYADALLWYFKSESLGFRVIICMLLPLAILFLFCIFNNLQRAIQRKRNFVAQQIELNSLLLHPKKNSNSVFGSISSVLAKAFGAEVRSEADEYQDLINSCGSDYKAAMKKMRCFIKKRLINNPERVRHITIEQAKLNAVEWKALNAELQEFLKKKTCAS